MTTVANFCVVIVPPSTTVSDVNAVKGQFIGTVEQCFDDSLDPDELTDEEDLDDPTPSHKCIVLGIPLEADVVEDDFLVDSLEELLGTLMLVALHRC